MKRFWSIVFVIVFAIVFTAFASADGYCPNCGTRYSGNPNYCNNCGGSLKSGYNNNSYNNNSNSYSYTQESGLDNLPVLYQQGTSRINNPTGDLPVYTGPGKHYYRSSSGNGAISDNQRVYVYGREGGYLLVKYNTTLNDEPISRYAFAPVDRVGNGYDFGYLSLGSVPIKINSSAKLVDEPDSNRRGYTSIDMKLNSATALAIIYDDAGRPWVYFETEGYSAVTGSNNVPVRGFVLKSQVTETSTAISYGNNGNYGNSNSYNGNYNGNNNNYNNNYGNTNNYSYNDHQSGGYEVGMNFYITVSSGRVRMYPAEDTIVAYVHIGETYSILDSQTGSDGKTWYKINQKGTIGWVSSGIGDVR